MTLDRRTLLISRLRLLALLALVVLFGLGADEVGGHRTADES